MDDDLIDEIYEHSREDEWCGHDLSVDSLRKIIARVRAYDARKSQEIPDEPTSV